MTRTTRTVSRWLVSVAVLASALPVSAQIALVPPPHIQTLDVSMMRGIIVATGRVVDFQPVPAKTDNWRTTVLVSETLRGRPNATLIVEIGRLRSRGDTPVRTESILDGWLRSWALLLIAVPTDTTAAPVIIDLSDPELAVTTAELELLRTPDAVVDAAKEIIRRAPVVATSPTFGVAVEVTKVAGTPVDTRVLGFEIVDSVFADWKFQPSDFVAAYGLHAALIVGEPRAVDEDTIASLADALPSFPVRLDKNGSPAAEGSGRNSLRSPALCLGELASAIARRPGAEPLKAAELISSGTLTEPQPIEAGDTWTARADGLGLSDLTLRVSS